MEPNSEPKAVTDHLSLKKRALTSAGLVATIFAALFAGAPGVLCLMLLINALAMHEYQQLLSRAGFSLQRVSGHLLGAAVIVMIWLVAARYCPLQVFVVFIPVLPVLYVVELYRKTATPFQNTGLTFSGVVWISFSLALFLFIGFLPAWRGVFKPQLLLGYFVILWAGDTGAYFIGRHMGKHPLFYRISPKKTWEGSMGGMVFALLAGVSGYFLCHLLPLTDWIILALIINVTGTFGDFTKSMLKRSLGVKDTGTILPGHGGVLDRFDSLIGSVPFAFIYLLWRL